MKKTLTLSFLLAITPLAFAFEDFVIQDIQIEGLERVSTGAVLNAIDIEKGERFDAERSNSITRALFKLGYFESIQLDRADDNKLVIKIKERPTIGQIEIEGSKTVKNEELVQSLKDIGFAQGRTFNAAQLNDVRKDMLRQLHAVGRYAATVDVVTQTLPRNRVGVKMTINEGPMAVISSIEFKGNKIFSDEYLRKQMKSAPTNALSWFTKDDQYNKARLSADLEAIRSHMMNRGYLNFSIPKTQVTLTEDKKGLKILIQVNEGRVIKIHKIVIKGTDLITKNDLDTLEIHEGEVFSREKTIAAMKQISSVLGQAGYPFAEVSPMPEPVANMDDTVNMVFYVETGKRTLIDKIHFSGNDKTKDSVLRREMDVFEGGVASSTDIEMSRTKLMRLGFFETVDVSTKATSEGKVDVVFDVAESRINQFGGGVGYNDTEGMLFNLNMKNQNFMGTGDAFDVVLNSGNVNKTVNLHYDQPYWSPEGISRGFNFFYNKTKLSKGFDISQYVTDALGGSLNFGAPIRKDTRAMLSLGYTNTHLKLAEPAFTPMEITRFVNANGTRYRDGTLTLGVQSNTYDKAIFPTRGIKNAVSIFSTVPGSDLQYYKLNIKNNYYKPLPKGFVFTLASNIAYGQGYGKTDGLPFFKNSFAGGFGTVRGFKEGSLGPKDSNGLKFGGNLLVSGSAGLVIPNFWSDDAKQYRIALFMDAGQVYDTHNTVSMSDAFSSRNPNGIRLSSGVSFSWISPLGPIVLNLAVPIISHDGDKIKTITPSLGVLE